MTAIPRLVVSAPSSGHGKTAFSVGLIAAFASTGLTPAGFKVGPDHTDAAYLGLAAGRPGRNLDPRLVGPHRVAPLFVHGSAGADIAVVEGTMGLFDSLAGRSEADSTAGVAGTLRAPVVLVVDVAAMGQSIAALVHGFRAYDELIWLGGVVLNRVASDRHEQMLREALEEIGVPVLGALRRGDLVATGPSALPARSHGVVPVLHRAVEATRAVRRLGERVARAVDLERLLALARSAPRLSTDAWSASDAAASADVAEPVTLAGGRRPVVALAGTPAVAYGYAETAELLAAAGAMVVTVDPLRDEALPSGTDALVVCGGLPESYAEDLSANARLRAAVAELARSGRPVLAEGTGLLWLAREFDGRQMCGVLDAVGVRTNHIVIGYREATARASSPVAQLGSRVVGYKQHRSVVTPRAGQTPAWTWSGGAPEGFVWRRVHASFLTLHWAGVPEIARRLLAAASTSTPATPPVPPGLSVGMSLGAQAVSGRSPLGYPAVEAPTTPQGAGAPAPPLAPAAQAGSPLAGEPSVPARPGGPSASVSPRAPAPLASGVSPAPAAPAVSPAQGVSPAAWAPGVSGAPAAHAAPPSAGVPDDPAAPVPTGGRNAPGARAEPPPERVEPTSPAAEVSS